MIDQTILDDAQAAGFDVDTDGDIWGSENGSLVRFAQLCTQRAAGNVPDGYVLVPIEPTRKMYEASINSGSPWNITDAYKAMIAAAPTQPTTEGQEGKGL